MCPIAWDDGPRTGKPPPPVPVHNVRFKSQLLLLGPVVGVFVHWNYNRTLPCLGVKCHHCSQGLPSRWAGYVPAHLWRGKQPDGSGMWSPVVWYFPGNLREQVDAVAELHGLRRTIVAVEKKSDGGRVSYAPTVNERQKTELVPETFDLRVHLMKLWRYGDPNAAVRMDEVLNAAGERDQGDDDDGPHIDPLVLKFRPRKQGGAA